MAKHTQRAGEPHAEWVGVLCTNQRRSKGNMYISCICERLLSAQLSEGQKYFCSAAERQRDVVTAWVLIALR